MYHINCIYREIAEYTLDGFNAVVLGYGQRGSGKTQSLLGYSDYSGTGESNASARQGDNSFLASYLKELYAFQESVCFNKKKYKPRSCVTIGVSVWCLLNQGTIDLCAINDVAGPNGRASLVGAEYAIVECPTLDIALQVVHSARTEVKHACSAELDETELCHMFVRVTVHQELFTASDYSGTGAHENHTGRRGEGELAGLNHELKCSQLHLVDLIGTAGAASSPHRPKEPKDLMRRREEENMIAYRGHCNALSTLAKVVSEMKQVSKESSKVSLLQAQPHIKGHAAYSASVEQMRAVNSRSIQDRSFHQSDRQHTAEVVSKLTSAREHKLTMMLAPLLQGNNKTFYVVCVRDGSANYTQSKAALGLFADVGRDVRCACFRVQDVQLHDLHMVHYQTALRVPRQVTSKEARASLSHSGGRRMGTPVELESTPQSNEEEKDEIPFIPPMPDYCLLSPYATAHYSSGEPAMQPVVVESGDHAHGPRTSRVHFDDRPQAQDVRRYRHAGPDSLANSVELGTVESAPSLLNTMLPPFNYNLSDADKSAADTVKEDDADTSISPGPTQSGASALNASSPSLMDLAMSNEFYDDGSIEAPQLDSVGADVQSVGADSTLAAAPVTSRSYVEAMNRFYEEERNQHCDAAEASSSGNLALEDKGSADMSNVSDSAALRNKWYVSATGTNSSNSHQSGAGGHSSEGLHPGMNSTAMLSSYRQLNNESQENQAGAHQVKPSRSPSASPDRPIKFNNIMSEFSQLMQSMDADGTGDGTGVGSSFVVPSVYDSRDAIQSLAQSGHKPPQENRVDANTVDAPPPPPPVGGASDGRTLPAVLCASEEYIQNKLLLQEVIGNALNVRANGGDSTKPAVASVATSVSASVESSEDVRAQIKTDMRKVSERYVFGATPPGPSPSASQLGDEDENENDYGGDDPGAADESATLEEDSLDGAYKGKGGIAGSSLDNGDFEELNVSNAAEVVDSMPPRTGTSSPAPSSSPGRGRHPRSAASSGSDDDQDTRCYLTTISNMEKTRAAMQRKIDSLQGDLAEAELRRGLERDDSQKEIRALQLQVKDLCEDFSISSVFNSYEQHIHRLVQENAELRKRNIELECGDYGAGSGPRGAGDHGDGVEPFQPPINTNNKTIYPSGRPSPPGVVSLKSTTQPAGLRGDYERPPENAFDEYVHTNAGTNSSSLDYFKKACAMLKNKLRKSGVERMQLKTEVEDLQKKARQYNVAVKLTQDSHRRLKALYFENKVVKEQLQAERSRGLVNMKDIQSLTKDNADVAAAEARLREERARILGVCCVYCCWSATFSVLWFHCDVLSIFWFPGGGFAPGAPARSGCSAHTGSKCLACSEGLHPSCDIRW